MINEGISTVCWSVMLGGGESWLNTILPKTDRTRVGLGSDQGLRGQSPTTNRQGRGTALSIVSSWRLPAASSQTAINYKCLFFRRCASPVDVLQHAVFRQQRKGGICYVP